MEKNDFIVQILQLFLGEVPPLVVKLQIKFKEKKWKEVQAIAHKLRSNFAAVGANRPSRCCALIEENAGDIKKRKSLHSLMNQLNTSSPCVETELKRALGRLHSTA